MSAAEVVKELNDSERYDYLVLEVKGLPSETGVLHIISSGILLVDENATPEQLEHIRYGYLPALWNHPGRLRADGSLVYRARSGCTCIECENTRHKEAIVRERAAARLEAEAAAIAAEEEAAGA